MMRAERRKGKTAQPGLTLLGRGGDHARTVRRRTFRWGLAALVALPVALVSCGVLLGIPGSVSVADDATPTATLEPLADVGAYCLGYGFACAVTGGTQVVCWGRDIACLSDAGDASGAGTPAPALLTPTVVPLPPTTGPIVALTCGTDHACALLPGTSGTGLLCWGQNGEGQITGLPDDVCHGATDIYATDAALHVGYHFVQAVSAGDRVTCALASDTQSTQVQCWGAQLGDAQAPYTMVPPAVNADGGVPTLLAVGGQHACAYVVDGGLGSGVYCWGRNSSDQLGPVLPEGGSRASALVSRRRSSGVAHGEREPVLLRGRGGGAHHVHWHSGGAGVRREPRLGARARQSAAAARATGRGGLGELLPRVRRRQRPRHPVPRRQQLLPARVRR